MSDLIMRDPDQREPISPESVTDVWSTVPVLRGELVTLEPLSLQHVPALQAAAADGELWRLWYTSVPAFDATGAYVKAALAEQVAGVALPFAVRDARGDVVGTTRMGHIARVHRRLEIGWTWYAQRAQRTGLNTQAKQLLLSHAFETMGANCVQLLTNWHNAASRAAITRLGARQDGVLRSHMLNADGSSRDSVVFSITAADWPSVKRHLAFLRGQHVGGRRADGQRADG